MREHFVILIWIYDGVAEDQVQQWVDQSVSVCVCLYWDIITLTSEVHISIFHAHMCTYGARSRINVHRLVVVVMVVEVACSKKGYSFWVRKFVSDGAVHQTPSMRHSLLHSSALTWT